MTPNPGKISCCYTPHEITWRNNVPVPAKGEPERLDIPEAEPLRLECEHFLACVKNGQRPTTDGREGLRVLRVLNAAQRSLNLDGAKIIVNPAEEIWRQRERREEGKSATLTADKKVRRLEDKRADLPATLSLARRAGVRGRRSEDRIEKKLRREEGESATLTADKKIRRKDEHRTSNVQHRMMNENNGDRGSGCFVHDTAVIDDGCEIGRGTKIWHFSHILSNSRIGGNCNIGQNVVIGPDVEIGENCKIQNNVSIYKGVTLEDGVFCGPSMVFTNIYNPRAEIRKMDQIRTTLVKRGASIGANATIICGVTIGRYAFIGAGAVATKNVPDYALVVGNPAKQIGWACECGVKVDPQLCCLDCGKEYEEMDGVVREVLVKRMEG